MNSIKIYSPYNIPEKIIAELRFITGYTIKETNNISNADLVVIETTDDFKISEYCKKFIKTSFIDTRIVLAVYLRKSDRRYCFYRISLNNYNPVTPALTRTEILYILKESKIKVTVKDESSQWQHLNDSIINPCNEILLENDLSLEYHGVEYHGEKIAVKEKRLLFLI